MPIIVYYSINSITNSIVLVKIQQYGKIFENFNLKL